VLEEYEEAVQECWKSVNAGEMIPIARNLGDPQGTRLWYRLQYNPCKYGARTAEGLGRPREALAFLEKELEVWPESDQVYEEMADIFGA